MIFNSNQTIFIQLKFDASIVRVNLTKMKMFVKPGHNVLTLILT